MFVDGWDLNPNYKGAPVLIADHTAHVPSFRLSTIAPLSVLYVLFSGLVLLWEHPDSNRDKLQLFGRN